MTKEVDDRYGRLLKVLDTGLDSLRSGDGAGTILALQEALKTAEAMQQKPAAIAAGLVRERGLEGARQFAAQAAWDEVLAMIDVIERSPIKPSDRVGYSANFLR